MGISFARIFRRLPGAEEVCIVNRAQRQWELPMSMEEIRDFEVLFRALITSNVHKKSIEILFQEAAEGAGLEKKVWLGAPMTAPRRPHKPG
jgi:hypothetical protein